MRCHVFFSLSLTCPQDITSLHKGCLWLHLHNLEAQLLPQDLSHHSQLYTHTRSKYTRSIPTCRPYKTHLWLPQFSEGCKIFKLLVSEWPTLASNYTILTQILSEVHRPSQSFHWPNSISMGLCQLSPLCFHTLKYYKVCIWKESLRLMYLSVMSKQVSTNTSLQIKMSQEIFGFATSTEIRLGSSCFKGQLAMSSLPWKKNFL